MTDRNPRCACAPRVKNVPTRRRFSTSRIKYRSLYTEARAYGTGPRRERLGARSRSPQLVPPNERVNDTPSGSSYSNVVVMAFLATATVRSYTIIFVLLLISVILLATAYLPPSFGTAFWGRLRESNMEQRLTQSEWVAEEEISLTEQTNGTQGYLMARFYVQQMTAGIMNFFELSNIAARLNLSTIEPFVQDTRLMGIPDLNPPHKDNGFWTLSKFYDLDHLQTILKSCSSLLQLVSFNTVLRKTPNNVVIVFFLTGGYKYFKDYFPGGKYPNIVELDHKKVTGNTQVKQTLTILNTCMKHFSKLQQKQLPQFHHPRVLLTDARPFHSLSLSAVTEEIGSIVSEEANKSGPVLVIFDSWRGHMPENKSNFFYYMPDFHLNPPTCGARIMHHSKAVIEAAHDFSQSLNQTQPVIGVHIRGERLLIATKGNFSHCLRQLTTLLKTLTNTSKIPSERVNVFHDLGDFGTKSCNYGHCARGRSKLLSQIHKLPYPVRSFDPTMYKSVPVSPAFASFVEREYLAHVDTLVMVGGGGFQLSIVGRFLQNSDNGRDKYYSVCC